MQSKFSNSVDGSIDNILNKTAVAIESTTAVASPSPSPAIQKQKCWTGAQRKIPERSIAVKVSQLTNSDTVLSAIVAVI